MKIRMIPPVLVLLSAFSGAGCSDTAPEDHEAVKAVEQAQDKAREMQEEENKRVEEVNEALEE